MSSPSLGSEVDLDLARSWADQSLDRGAGDFGSTLCDSIRSQLAHATSAFLLVRPGDPRIGEPLSEWGAGKPLDVEAGVQFLHMLSELGAMTLIVEADMDSRRDGGYGGEKAAFCGERVERWSLIADIEESIALLRAQSYPLNAFITSRSPVELNLRVGAELGSEEIDAVNASLVAHLTQAFDGEAWLAVTWLSRWT